MEFFVSKKGNVNCNNHPHNYYLQIAAELGIVGLLLVIFIYYYYDKMFQLFKIKETNFHEKSIIAIFYYLYVRGFSLQDFEAFYNC